MREILFRGKTESGEWVYGSLVKRWLSGFENIGVIKSSILQLSGGDDGNQFETNEYDVAPSTIGQYTGLKDKNGTKIFEGDICKFKEWDGGEMIWVGEVSFEHSQYIITGNCPKEESSGIFYFGMARFIPERLEVIGNIHEEVQE